MCIEKKIIIEKFMIYLYGAMLGHVDPRPSCCSISSRLIKLRLTESALSPFSITIPKDGGCAFTEKYFNIG